VKFWLSYFIALMAISLCGEITTRGTGWLSWQRVVWAVLSSIPLWLMYRTGLNGWKP